MMEKTLKERIIGATVLVAAVVLIVPVFLDGPPAGGEIVSELVPLPGQGEQKSQTIVLDRDREEPVPARSGAAPDSDSDEQKPATTSTPPQKSATAQQEPEPQPDRSQVVTKTAKSTPKSPTESTTGMWAVQLGSFSNQKNAEKLAANLRTQGFAAFLSQASANSGSLHRVRIGPQKDREAAEAMAARLTKAGHTGKVLPHP